MQPVSIVGSRSLVKTRLDKFVGSWLLDGSNTLGNISLENLCIFLYSNSFTSELFFAQRTAEKVFMPNSLVFLFSYTLDVILVCILFTFCPLS